MTKIDLTITFAGDEGAVRSETRSFSSDFPADLSGEHRVAHNLFADLSVSVGDLSKPKHSERLMNHILQGGRECSNVTP
jgi:hypothetical protein